MRVIHLVPLLLVPFVVADDKSYCQGECAKKYTEESQKASCLVGCGSRGSISDGSRGFIDCHNACGDAYNDTDSADRRACDFACSLPLTNVVMMKVDYGSGDSAPRVQVVRKEGGDVLGSDLGLGADFDHFILRPSDIMGDTEESDKTNDGKSVVDPMKNYNMPEGVLSNMFKIRTGDEEFDKMQDHLNKLVQSFFDRAQMASRVALERPSGHEDAAFRGDSASVGNVDVDGHQILLVAPMDGADNWVDLRDFEHPHESSLRRRFPSLFQWTVCLVLLIAIFCTMVIALLIVRQMRLHHYRALRSYAVSQNAAANAARADGTPSAAGGELVKKIPIDVEESYPAPEGCPPPAYDQLSVHSKKNASE